MSEFKRLTEVELGRMGDEQVVAYIDAARTAGEHDAVKEATGILAWGYEEAIRAKVARKVPSGHVDDVTMEVLYSIVKSSFEGKVLGEFRSFMYTITGRRIADFHKKRENDPGQDPLPGENGDDEKIWGEEPGTGDFSEAVAIRDAIDRTLATRSPDHQRIIRLYGPELVGEGLGAAETVERLAADGLEVSESNVQQVWHRFKVDLAKQLESGEDGDDPDG